MDTLAQVLDEVHRINGTALPDAVGDYQFSPRLNRHPDVGVSPLIGVVLIHVIFFGVDERPKLVGLDNVRRHVLNALIEHLAAFFASGKQQAEDSGLVYSGETFNSPNADPFHHQPEYVGGFLQFDPVIAQGPRLRLGEGRATGMAAIALDAPPSVESEFLGNFVLAFNIGHIALHAVMSAGSPRMGLDAWRRTSV